MKRTLPPMIQRVSLYSSVVLALEATVTFILAWSTFSYSGTPQAGFGIDFSVYWNASVVALKHGAAAVFDQHALMAVEQTVRPTNIAAGTSGPWLYPPTFLIFVLPLGLLPLNVALLSFSIIGAAAYLRSLWAIVRPIGFEALIPLAAFPGMWLALCYGQNSLLTMAAAGAGLALIPTRPILAGLFIALLGVKPQLGLLFPLALICGRHWRTFLSATVCSILLWSFSTAALGTETLSGFFQTTSWFRQTWLENYSPMWRGMPTIYAIARRAGASASLGYWLQAAVAVPTCAVLGWLWRGGARFELKAGALCCCTLLVQPYFLYYDLAWLALPIAFFAMDLYRHGARPVEWSILIAAWLIPAQSLIATTLPSIGQWAPALLILFVATIVYRSKRRSTNFAEPLINEPHSQS